MIDLLIVALLQATDPQTPPAQTAPTETTSEALPADAAATETPATEAAAEPQRPGRRCDQDAPTGSRVRSRRVMTCTTEDSRDLTSEAARRLANSGGGAGQTGEVVGRRN